ncbi:hypothetical protein GCM10012288_18580 [Malaciobacter pacificus]|jgi:predicted MPP superfamily phosphohydrolase|uniref:Metallophosphoesterase (YkuE domain) n=1 Tax=Malaciobacter pacificus TaxID=1080223 RepID=A0A5C2H8T9_9BACT|nr:metallophosphoesterase [Malaciobacter pacificus]QEP33636.1 metallophosphoesterase (YkuE domain) [Malaciobacter pacificus]GGD44559.1 hypothetical protein GCM10012288_18580 [Malaciobacter pacificus]
MSKRSLPKARTLEVKVSNEKLNHLKLLHLSDLHINKNFPDEILHELVFYCNSLDYDFTVITGDIIDCKVKNIKEKLAILNNLKGDVYFISGNHDLVYGLNDLKKELTNFIFMDNEIKKIEYKNEIIKLVGLSDRFSKFFGIKRDEKKILASIKESEPTIFISHQPKDYKLALNSNLFLCGHTHGGQIFPFHYLVKIVQPFLSGLHYVKDTAIYVNSGLGTWGIDMRYKAPSEITILELIHKSVE